MKSVLLLILTLSVVCVACRSEPPETASRLPNASDETPTISSVTPQGPSEPTPPVQTDADAEADTAFKLNLLSWNVESEGADPTVIAQQLTSFSNYDVMGLTEVLPAASDSFRKSAGENFQSITSRSGRNDRMMLIYNPEILELVRKFEIRKINFQDRYRSPLVGHFRHLGSQQEFIVMVNHLARGKESIRQTQAKQLVEWARNETLPIIALGDYNFDYVFDTEKGNEAFRLFQKDGIWKWVQPVQWVDTNWYDDPAAPDGEDDYPGSMLDFAFVANGAKDWQTRCEIIVRDGDFPDDEKTSDHRPYRLSVSAP